MIPRVLLPIVKIAVDERRSSSQIGRRRANLHVIVPVVRICTNVDAVFEQRRESDDFRCVTSASSASSVVVRHSNACHSQSSLVARRISSSFPPTQSREASVRIAILSPMSRNLAGDSNERSVVVFLVGRTHSLDATLHRTTLTELTELTDHTGTDYYNLQGRGHYRHGLQSRTTISHIIR